MKVSMSNILTAYVGAELLDKVLATCNYEASGDGCVLVDTDQLDNTTDTSGEIGEMAEKIQRATRRNGFPLNLKTLVGAEYTGLILLRA